MDAMCMPDARCRCCECQGKHCLMWHPGHSHHDAPEDFLSMLSRLSKKEKRMAVRAKVTCNGIEETR